MFMTKTETEILVIKTDTKTFKFQSRDSSLEDSQS